MREKTADLAVVVVVAVIGRHTSHANHLAHYKTTNNHYNMVYIINDRYLKKDEQSVPITRVQYSGN